jgi:hypothetical protein
MSVLLQILAFWIPLSCVICPLFTWAFFRAERQVEQEPDGVNRDGTVVYFDKWSMPKELRRTI